MLSFFRYISGVQCVTTRSFDNFQHEAAQKTFHKAKEQINSIKQKIIDKEKELHTIDTSISKNQSIAKEGHENEQVHSIFDKEHDSRCHEFLHWS